MTKSFAQLGMAGDKQQTTGSSNTGGLLTDQEIKQMIKGTKVELDLPRPFLRFKSAPLEILALCDKLGYKV